MPRLDNHGTIRAKKLDIHNTLRFLHTNNTYHHDLVGTDATSANITNTLPNKTGTLITSTPNTHITLDQNKEIRFHNENAKIYNEGIDGNLTAWAGNRVRIEANGSDLELKSNVSDVVLMSNRDVRLLANDGTEFLKCSKATDNVVFSKPADFNGTVQLDGETTSNAQFNQNENLHLMSGKDLRLGGGGTHKINRTGNDINISNSVVSSNLNLECVSINLKGTTAVNVVECPTIFTSPAVANLADNGSIPITSTLINVDANGGDRTGIRFAGTGVAGQMLIVQNSGAEKLTFHNTEGTSLVKAIHANHDTMEGASVYMFISTGALWCIIGGGKGSGTQLVAS